MKLLIAVLLHDCGAEEEGEAPRASRASLYIYAGE